MSVSGAAPSCPACPVCLDPAPRPFITVGGRDYWRCEICEATFLVPAQRPAQADERAEYLLHANDLQDIGYRRFLFRLAEPLLVRLPPACDGLDYGCGPGPALATMLREAGHRVALYDPFFAPDAAVLMRRYDFITCTEVAEHFHDPATEFSRFDRMLHPGGWLALMTCFQTDDARFANWHYRRDPTHVVFYREATFRHIARLLGWQCEIPCKDVVLMQKPGAAHAV
ncbi:class I SAM-dependent methyltransferase [Thauera sp. WH-2]|uniref:class I SAM-dependent methyltransferase n=1 Tax=unclassified Thauera TaxID=2609274 RepID=UPI003AAAEC79